MERVTLERLSGAVGVFLTLGAIFLATVVSPDFRWTAHALSNLGVTTTAPGTDTTALLFNGGLTLGGLVSLGFAAYLFRAGRTALDRAVGVSYAITVLTMATIGVFPQGRSLHFPVAVAFYLLVSVTLLTAAGAAYRTDELTWSVTSLALGSLNLGVWIVWGLLGPVRRDGLAVPEIAGAVAFAAWVLLAVRRSRLA